MISVIIPIYNEEQNILPMYARMAEVFDKLNVKREYIYVNDGSEDDSEHVIKRLAKQHADVKYINFSRNFGHQVAVSAGLDKAEGDKVVMIDADGQDPPEVIEELYLKSLEGFEVVYAKRESRKVRDGEVVTACASACPTNAITFGDLNDKNSEIVKVLEPELDKRAYNVLHEINTRPNVWYLTKVRNQEEAFVPSGVTPQSAEDMVEAAQS